jgi:hypothetical protein
MREAGAGRSLRSTFALATVEVLQKLHHTAAMKESADFMIPRTTPDAIAIVVRAGDFDSRPQPRKALICGFATRVAAHLVYASSSSHVACCNHLVHLGASPITLATIRGGLTRCSAMGRFRARFALYAVPDSARRCIERSVFLHSAST